MAIQQEQHQADHRPGRYIDEDTGRIIYRASEFSMCPRRLWAYAQGMTPAQPPAVLQKAFDQGSAAEYRILERFAEEYELLVESQQDEIEWPVAGVVIRAHSDGRVSHPDTGVEDGVEVKFLAGRYDSAEAVFKKFPYYAWQISAMMHGTGMPWWLVVGNKDKDGEIAGIQAWFLSVAPVTKTKVIKHILGIEEAIDEGQMPECSPAGGAWGCPFYYLHDEGEHEGETEMSKGDRAMVIGLARQQARLKEREKEVAAEVDRVKKELKVEMDRLGHAKVRLVDEDGNLIRLSRTVTAVAESTKMVTTKAYVKDYVTVTIKKDKGEMA